MATAQQIINRALTSIGVLASGETATANQSADALVSLNDLLQAWSNDGLLVSGQTIISKAMSGAASYTIGSGGDINTSRPTEFDNIYYSLNSVDYPVKIVTLEEYDSIPNKSVTGTIPDIVAFRFGYPLITMYIYPQPSSGTLYLETFKPLTEFASLATSASFPVGYERALRLNLAVELMPEYGIDNPTLVGMALEAKNALKRTNYRAVKLKNDVPTGWDVYSNILQG